MLKQFAVLVLLLLSVWGIASGSVSAESGLSFPDADFLVCDPTANRSQAEPLDIEWAFEETFDGDPDAPSQALLPASLDYSVTHRVHAKDLFTPLEVTYPADHSDSCAGPNPTVDPLPQHQVLSSNSSSGDVPDASFYICKNHMMTSMGEVSFYAVTTFWPRQEFNFADGGVIEFDVSINDGHDRVWWEVMLMPRNQLKLDSARHFFPIDEIYPRDHIVFDYHENRRRVQVGQDSYDQPDPIGILVDERRPLSWAEENPTDPANGDRRIRRTMRLLFENNRIGWATERVDGTFSTEYWDVPGGLPFEQGLVVFKTHAYTPTKADNYDAYTFHWDNLRFSGPWAGDYESFEASDVIYLERNGDRPIGDSQTVTIDLPRTSHAPALFGQLHNPMLGQVLLSINGGEPFAVSPHDYVDGDAGETNCYSDDWKAFYVELSSGDLQVGENTLEWTVGPRPECAPDGYPYNGFSVKDLEIQLERPPLYLPMITR